MDAFPVIGLDEDDALRAEVAGAKAAALARALRRGLPVLPGLVVPAACGLPFLEAAASGCDGQGAHAACLAVMTGVTAAESRFGELRERAGSLGPVLVVRSSGRSEDDPRWAGAYTSVLDVQPDDLVAAIASCWSSALGDDAVFRRKATGASLAAICPAVLIQPQVTPRLAGTATCAPGEPVAVVAARGSPAPLLAGHVPGQTATVDRQAVRGAALELAEASVFRQVAAITRTAGAGTPATVEWAMAGDRVLLLQVSRAARDSLRGPDGPPRPAAAAPGERSAAPGTSGSRRDGTDAAAGGRLLLLAGLVARYAGPLGEHAVLPWLAAHALRGDIPEPAHPGDGAGDGHDDFEAALRLVPRAITEAWPVPDGAVAGNETAVLALLSDGDVDRVLSEIARLPAACSPGPGAAAQTLLGLLARVGAVLVRRGVLANPAQIWQLRPDQVRAMLAAPEPAGWNGMRRRTLRWQPFLQSALARFGTRLPAEPASPGTTAGVGRLIRRPEDIRALVPGEVAVVDRPHPQFAPVLWTAGALLAQSGSPAAHLMEVARSLRVPALCASLPAALEDPRGPALDAVRIEPGSRLLCVDGDNGVLTIGPIVTATTGT